MRFDVHAEHHFPEARHMAPLGDIWSGDAFANTPSKVTWSGSGAIVEFDFQADADDLEGYVDGTKFLGQAPDRLIATPIHEAHRATHAEHHQDDDEGSQPRRRRTTKEATS